MQSGQVLCQKNYFCPVPKNTLCLGELINRIGFTFPMSSKNAHKNRITAYAKNLGFSFVGYAKAGFLEEEAAHLEEWLNRGYQGEMAYMAKPFRQAFGPHQIGVRSQNRN